METSQMMGHRRMLDGPRWFVPDAYAEKYYHLSPYLYAANNPINFTDVKGDRVYFTDTIGN